MNNVIVTVSLLILTKVIVRAHETPAVPFHRLRQLSLTRAAPLSKLATLLHPSVQKQCYANNVLVECPPAYPADFTTNLITNIRRHLHNFVGNLGHQDSSNSAFDRTAQIILNALPLRRKINQRPVSDMIPLLGKLDGNSHQNTEDPTVIDSALRSTKFNMDLSSLTTKPVPLTSTINSLADDLIPSHKNELDYQLTEATATTFGPSSTVGNLLRKLSVLEEFDQSLDNFERQFYATTFSKLTSISPASRRENGMSYVQSGLFLQLALMALSTEVNAETRREIDDSLGLHNSDQERIDLINATMSSLPVSSDDLKFRWSTRLLLQAQGVSEGFRATAAAALRLQIDRFNGPETPKEMAMALNHMVEIDSGGAIHDTFEEEDFSEGARAVLITTLYMRARWRAAPTLLNGTRPFRDSDGTPERATRMIKVNDVMRYALLAEWDAEALEIFYSTPGLSLLMLVPRGNSLRRLADEAVTTNLKDITSRMRPLRIAATLPLYTLRMTLLLPNKLELMNMSRLVDTSGSRDEFRLSHAVQRIMFWAEAGRNAFKDDGLEWDEPPDHELVVDRPYIFYVRWKNKTLMSGNFVL